VLRNIARANLGIICLTFGSLSLAQVRTLWVADPKLLVNYGARAPTGADTFPNTCRPMTVLDGLRSMMLLGESAATASPRRNYPAKLALMWHSLTDTWPIVFSIGIGNLERDYG
jgi:hypothetical protein